MRVAVTFAVQHNLVHKDRVIDFLLNLLKLSLFFLGRSFLGLDSTIFCQMTYWLQFT